MSKQTVRPKRLGRNILAFFLFLIVCGVIAAFLAPRLLVQQATQKPVDAGTFVTRQTHAQVDQGSQSTDSNQDVNQAPDNAPPATSFQERVQRAIKQASQAQANTTAPTDSTSQTSNIPDSADSNSSEATSQTSEPNEIAAPDSSNSTTNTPVSDGKFRVQMSESEISNLLYSGLIQGTAPEYQAAIQGVSTRIQSGRAKITVALVPEHLPEAFLKNLPGVSRSTPTVYLGGEMSLISQGQSVIPVIHELSLGNFKVPIPFLQAAIQNTVQQQTQSMMTLPNGQQAHLEQILLENGAMTLVGQVN